MGMIATLAGVAISAVLAGPASATYPGHNGRLVIAVGGPGGRGSPASLATVAPDGSGLLRLRAGADPVWRPDGRRIEFTLPGGSQPGTATMTAGGSGVRVRKIADAPGHRRVTSYSTSPSGRRIAYSMRLPHAAGDGWAVYVARPDGTHPRRALTTMGHYAYMDQLRWSPDGHTLLGVESQIRLWLIPASGHGARVLVDPGPNGRAFDPSWSPDGREVLYAIDPGPGPPGDKAVMVVGADGRDPQLLVDGAYLPVWSPDGQQIAYETTDGKLTIAGRDGSDPRTVLNGRVDALDWQPLR
jgi:Tol biopolymer transport system component